MKIPEIKETKDYSNFKRLEGNRDVKCVKKIIDSINKVGYLFSPIMVNEQMQVIDGQNRLEAAKQLKLPVYYYVQPNIGIDEAIELNLGRTNWKPIDYVKSYAEQGQKSYQMLVDLIDEYPWFKFQEIAAIAANYIITSGWLLNNLAKGHYELSENDIKKAKEKLNILNKMQPALSKTIGTRRLYISALAWCYGVKGVNKDRLTRVFNEKYPMLRPVCEVEMFLKDLSDIYNKGLDRGKQMFFDFEYRTR